MNSKELIISELKHRLCNKEAEDVHWEYKSSFKFYNEERKKLVNADELAKILVAFSNREGGFLVIGIADDLSFESENICNKFDYENKSGFDKFTEFVSNVIRDKVSPNIEVNLFSSIIDKNEIIIIQIPKRATIPVAVVDGRDSSRIKKRIYYVRTIHGNELIDDKHLEWLFQNSTKERFESTSLLHITVNESGVPELGVINNEEIIQPNTYDDLSMLYIFFLDYNKLTGMSDYEERIFILLESILLSLGKSLEEEKYEQNKNPVTLNGDKLTWVKYMSEEAVINKVYQLKDAGSAEEYYWYIVNNGFKDDISIEYDKRHGKVIISSETKYYKFEVEICYKNLSFGLSPLNPYQWVNYKGLYNNDQNIKQDANVGKGRHTYSFTISFQGNLKYPEAFDDEYFESKKYISNLSSRIYDTWDIIKFHEKYPHYHIMYEVNRRIKKIENHLLIESECYE